MKIFIITALLVSMAHAKMGYVKNTNIPLFEQENPKSKVVYTFKSIEQVSVLKNGFLFKKVKTNNGITGFIRSAQFTLKKPKLSKKISIKDAEVDFSEVARKKADDYEEAVAAVEAGFEKKSPNQVEEEFKKQSEKNLKIIQSFYVTPESGREFIQSNMIKRFQ